MSLVEGTSAEVALEHPQVGWLLPDRVAQQLTTQTDALMSCTYVQARQLECGRVHPSRHAPAHDPEHTPAVLGESHDSRPSQEAIPPANFALSDPDPIQVLLRYQPCVGRPPAQGLKFGDGTCVLDSCATHRRPSVIFSPSRWSGHGLMVHLAQPNETDRVGRLPYRKRSGVRDQVSRN
jgi:hypothetical protein